MFIDVLNKELQSLNEHKRDKSLLIEYYVAKRLDKALTTYYNELKQSMSALNSKDGKFAVLRKLIG